MIGTLRKIFRKIYYTIYGKNGKTVKINNEDYVVSAYVSRGVNSIIDETPLKLLTSMCGRAKTVFDIGGNIGLISVLLSKRMTPGSVIYSFEPAPVSFKYLKDNARVQKGNAKIIPVNYAVSNSIGKLNFTNDGNSCLNHISSSASEETVSVDAITVDAFCAQNKIIPEVIKIDVEGAEYLVLQGMTETLSNNNCLVLLEIHSDTLSAQGVSGRMLYNIINSAGYTAYDTTGKKIDEAVIMKHACIILSKDKPADHIFLIN